MVGVRSLKLSNYSARRPVNFVNFHFRTDRPSVATGYSQMRACHGGGGAQCRLLLPRRAASAPWR
jgi:hypothetical protein